MQPDTTKIWTSGEIRVALGKILVESLGVERVIMLPDEYLAQNIAARWLKNWGLAQMPCVFGSIAFAKR